MAIQTQANKSGISWHPKVNGGKSHKATILCKELQETEEYWEQEWQFPQARAYQMLSSENICTNNIMQTEYVILRRGPRFRFCHINDISGPYVTPVPGDQYHVLSSFGNKQACVAQTYTQVKYLYIYINKYFQKQIKRI